MTADCYPPGNYSRSLRALATIGGPKPGEESINLSVTRPIVQPVANPSGQQFGSRHAREIWLLTNRRALVFGAVPPALLAALGAWLAFGAANAFGGWLAWLGIAVTTVGLIMVVALLVQVRQPRIAYNDGHVLFYLRSGAPLAVPVEMVEAFFLGQGPLMLSGGPSRGGATVNLVARLSQRAPEWSHQDVKPALGRWCDSYVTIRGAWCEPLTEAVIRRINRRLREVTEANAAIGN